MGLNDLADVVRNPTRWDLWIDRLRQRIIGAIAPSPPTPA